jgi:hypothetical protein
LPSIAAVPDVVVPVVREVVVPVVPAFERVVEPFVVVERCASGRPVIAGVLDALSLLPADALPPDVDPDELPLPPPPDDACARWIGALSDAMVGAAKQRASAATSAVGAGIRLFIVGLLSGWTRTRELVHETDR